MCDVCAGVQCEEGGDVEVETGGGEEGDLPAVDEDLGASREGSRTDDEAVERSGKLYLIKCSLFLVQKLIKIADPQKYIALQLLVAVLSHLVSVVFLVPFIHLWGISAK